MAAFNKQLICIHGKLKWRNKVQTKVKKENGEWSGEENIESFEVEKSIKNAAPLKKANVDVRVLTEKISV